MDIIHDFVGEVVKELQEVELNDEVRDADEFKQTLYAWMLVEYKNYMMLSRDTALETLNRLVKEYQYYKPLVKILINNINRYGSMQCYYRAALFLSK